jgi:hypothetical protein
LQIGISSRHYDDGSYGSSLLRAFVVAISLQGIGLRAPFDGLKRLPNASQNESALAYPRALAPLRHPLRTGFGQVFLHPGDHMKYKETLYHFKKNYW